MRLFVVTLLFLFFFSGCGNKRPDNIEIPKENRQAKKIMQGIWMDEDEGQPSFRVSGDSIYYPDTTSMPVRFAVLSDTLVLYGANTMKYPIVKQTEHILEFKNPNSEVVRLVKSSSKSDERFFENKRTVVLNQRRVIKRDTVVTQGDRRYHCYVQVNPTTYKVYKSYSNDEGVEVDNVYYDNSIHLALFEGAVKLYSYDFSKSDFSRYVPAGFLRQSVLSDMIFSGIDTSGVHYQAQMCIPDSPSSYVVEVTVSFKGEAFMKIVNY